MTRIVIAVALAALLAACQSGNQYAAGDDHRYWVIHRADGKSISSSPALTAEYKQDLIICRGKLAESIATRGQMANQLSHNTVSAAVVRGCLAERGYHIEISTTTSDRPRTS